MIHDLQKQLKTLEADLLDRSESPNVADRLRLEYDEAKQADRTAQNFTDWRSDAITQCAAAWVLSCVFVRFLEDNHLIEPPRISGPPPRLTPPPVTSTRLYFRRPPHRNRPRLPPQRLRQL